MNQNYNYNYNYNYNRYSYCLPARPQQSEGGNNPLMYTDPTGYSQTKWAQECFNENEGGGLDWSWGDNLFPKITWFGQTERMDGAGTCRYSYLGDGKYIDRYTGETVTYDVVFNYVTPYIWVDCDALIGVEYDDLRVVGKGQLLVPNPEFKRIYDSDYQNPSGGGGVRFANETDAYNYMWKYATDEKREYAAYITTKGVIVTPAVLNKAGQGEFLKYYNPTWKNGALFITFEDQKYQVIGGIHTHWRDNGDYGYDFSVPDDYTTEFLNGLPFFSMNFNNTMGAQYYDGKYCRPMDINASRDAVLGGFSLIKYIFNYGK